MSKIKYYIVLLFITLFSFIFGVKYFFADIFIIQPKLNRSTHFIDYINNYNDIWFKSFLLSILILFIFSFASYIISKSKIFTFCIFFGFLMSVFLAFFLTHKVQLPLGECDYQTTVNGKTSYGSIFCNEMHEFILKNHD
jgi:hypothetical protein